MLSSEKKADAISEILTRTFSFFFSDKFRDVIVKFVYRNYSDGMSKASKKYGVNVIPDSKNIKLLVDQTSEEIQGILTDLQQQVRQTVREGILNNDNPQDIKKRIKLLMNPTNEREYQFASGRVVRWSDRLETITRTESNRANNMGHLDTFKQSGLRGKKYLSIHPDERLCPICSAAGLLYTKTKAIELDEQFIVETTDGIYKFLAPPIHPNCRCRVMFDLI